jgi:nitric oxide synthase oxygenase domain/subunit
MNGTKWHPKSYKKQTSRKLAGNWTQLSPPPSPSSRLILSFIHRSAQQVLTTHGSLSAAKVDRHRVFLL